MKQSTTSLFAIGILALAIGTSTVNAKEAVNANSTTYKYEEQQTKAERVLQRLQNEYETRIAVNNH